jgi:hypothetical protein
MWNKRAYFAEKQQRFADDLLRTHSALEFFARHARFHAMVENQTPHAASSSSAFRHLLRSGVEIRVLFCSRRGSHLTLFVARLNWNVLAHHLHFQGQIMHAMIFHGHKMYTLLTQ